MTGRTLSDREMRDLSALAAGELPEEEARAVEERVRRDPELARRVAALRRARRALADFAAGADDGPEAVAGGEADDGVEAVPGAGDRPELRERLLAATLPAFRRRYGPAAPGVGGADGRRPAGAEAALFDPLERSLSALAAGELPEGEARQVRERMRREPEVASRYGDYCRARLALADFAAAAESVPGGGGARPELRDRLLAATLPAFRRRFARRTAYWPAWLAAAAALLLVAVVRPPPVAAALDRLFGDSGRVSRLAEAAADRRGRAAAELGEMRAEFGAALDDGMDRLGDRLRDFEQATRGRRRPPPAPEAPETAGEGRPAPPNRRGDTAP